MRNFQEKRKSKRLVESKPVLVLLCILLLFFAWNVFGLIGRVRETIKNKKMAQDKVENLQKQKDELLYNTNQLKTDKGIEENIREKFGFAKEGEGMVVVTDDKNVVEENTGNQSSSFFSFIKNLFK